MEIELAPLLHQQFEPAWTAAVIPATNYFPRKNSTTLELAAGSPPRSKTAASAGMFIKYRRRWRTDARILLRFRPRNSEAGGAVEGGSIFARGRGVEECIEYLGRQMGERRRRRRRGIFRHSVFAQGVEALHESRRVS